jgi:phosphoglycerate dehydrogenase-like enzyme
VTKPVVVVLGAAVQDPPPGIEAAADAVELRYAPDGEALPGVIADADGLFFWRAEGEWLRAALPSAPRLRWVQSASDGVDAVLSPQLVERDIEVTNARGVFDDAIAEWVIGAMLAFTSRILHQRDAQATHEWAHRTTERLAGARLLVVGPGPVGRAVAVRAKALGVHVGAAGRTARSDDLFGTVVSTSDLATFDWALRKADHVVDAMPLTDATRHLFDADRFAAMRPSARFYNVGRGATVDERALAEALAAGAIAGAALDVFEVEPLPPESPLWSMPQVLISPHMCGDFQGWQADVIAIFVENAGRFARGEPLRNPVDKRAGHGTG